MSEQHRNVIEYFKPPVNYFWHWTDAGYVIEWEEGDTICYRDDLLNILKKLTREGWPPLGSILLILSACREKPGTPAAEQCILYGTLKLLDYYEKHRSGINRQKLPKAIRFLQLVAALPLELRSGEIRIWLLYVIFKEIPCKVDQSETARFLNVFNSGKIDQLVFGGNTAGYEEGVVSYNFKTFSDDLSWLELALKVFPTADVLERAVRTGMPELPGVAEVEIPIQHTDDLLQQLAQDPNTAGLAQLTHRLVAALNIPMHAHGSSDQLFGGVSDITNRGNLDRLLLSELAHDDLSLMARLANNEALYLRREELPSHPEKQRILLIDTTIKMWGLPRVFAISAALACARNNKVKAQVLSYALFGNSFKEVDLTTKEGVVHSLEQLDATLHCGRGLTEFMEQAKVSDDDEVFLVTEEEALHSVLFQSILASLKKPVNFLVTVNRNGKLQFYECIKGRRKLLSEAKFDLQELLFKTGVRKKAWKQRPGTHELPAFMQGDSHPLFFPTSKIRFNADCFYELKKDHVVCITIDQRVLYWHSRKRGAMEIIDCLEPGRFCFGTTDGTDVFILVYSGSTKKCMLYEVNLDPPGTVEIVKLPETFSQVTEMVFYSVYFYIKSNDNLFSVNPVNGTVHRVEDNLSKFDEYVQQYKNRPSNLSYYKKLVNDGYTTLNTVRSVYINDNGELAFDERHVALKKQSGTIVIEHNRKVHQKNMRAWNTKEVEVPQMALKNKNLKFSKFVWEDGSEVLADSRGLLHLRSSDSTIPEITIVMIMGKPTACWASDGSVCGDDYFTGVNTSESRDGLGFYDNYIQRFIDTVKKYGASA